MIRQTKGQGTLLYLVARLMKKLRFSAIKNTKMHTTSKINAGSQIVGCEIGRHSYFGYDCVALNTKIGNFCSISDNVFIGGSGHPVEFVSTSPIFLRDLNGTKHKFSTLDFCHQPQTVIGSDVWIGHGTQIKAGVTIGHGSVVGMGAVVTKDVAPYTIVAGNPARLIRERFDEETRNRLLDISWWDWEDEKIRERAKLFSSPQLLLGALK